MGQNKRLKKLGVTEEVPKRDRRKPQSHFILPLAQHGTLRQVLTHVFRGVINPVEVQKNTSILGGTRSTEALQNNTANRAEETISHWRTRHFFFMLNSYVQREKSGIEIWQIKVLWSTHSLHAKRGAFDASSISCSLGWVENEKKLFMYTCKYKGFTHCWELNSLTVCLRAQF